MMQQNRFFFAIIMMTCCLLYMTTATNAFAGDGKSGGQLTGNIYRLALQRDNITLNFSGTKCYRDDLEDKYRRFHEESRRFETEEHLVTVIRDMVIRKLNQYDMFFATSRTTDKENIPLKMQLVFSPVPEGKLLAISSRMTLYVSGNPIQVGKGKAYTSAPYSEDSPFIQALKTALKDFQPMPFLQELERNKKYIKAIVLTADSLPTGGIQKELFLRLVEKVDRLTAHMEKLLKMKVGAVRGDGDDVKKIALAILEGQVTKEDIRLLKTQFETITANLFQLYNADCLILDSGSKIDHGISNVTITLPDGESGTYNVADQCANSSANTIQLKCEKNGNSYRVKPNSKYLAEIKLLGLDWAIQRYEKEKRIIAR